MQYFKFAKLTLSVTHYVWKSFSKRIVQKERVGIVDYFSSNQFRKFRHHMISFLCCIKELYVFYSFSKSIQRTHAHFLIGHTVILLYMYTLCLKLHLQNCPKECRQHWMGVIWRVQARPPLRLAALLAAPLRGSIWCIVICSMYVFLPYCIWQIILWSISDSSLKAASFSSCHFQWFSYCAL